MTNTQPNVHPDDLYSRSEAARALGVSPKTLDNYTRDGRIPYRTRKCNGRRCWRGSDLIRCWREVL